MGERERVCFPRRSTMPRIAQRGFTLYALLAAGVVILLLGAGLKWQTSRLEDCKADVGRLEAAIAVQNAAVEAMRAEAAKKQAAASKALAGATQKARTWEDNAARLRAVLTAPRPAGEAAPTDCKAAWREIRKP